MTTRHRSVALLISCIACLSAAPGLAANLITNGSFENPVLSPGGAVTFATGTTIPNPGGSWTVLGNPGTSVYLLQDTYFESYNDVSQFNAQNGLNSVDLSGPANQGPTVGIQQTVATTPGQSYTLSFYVGRVTPNAGPGNVYTGAATVDVSIDGGTRQSFTNSNITNGSINWRQFSIAFTATGATTTVAFLNGTPAGTNEAGLDNVYLTANTATGVGDTPPARALYLAAPLPNPARDGWLFQYSLSRSGNVRLSVYSVDGRRIQLLADAWQEMGTHQVHFAARDAAGRTLASGVYFVRLEAEGRTLTQKLLLIR